MKINKKEEGQQSVKVKHATGREKKSESDGKMLKRMKSGEGESRVEWSDSPHITCFFSFSSSSSSSSSPYRQSGGAVIKNR